MSICCFGIASLAAMDDATTDPARTRAYSFGALAYHCLIAATYLAHVGSGTLKGDRLGGATFHFVGALGFAHHLMARIYR